VKLPLSTGSKPSDGRIAPLTGKKEAAGLLLLCFGPLLARLRGAQARSREALIEAMGATLSAISDRDASSLFRHCGHWTTAQLL
jgi:hypothetical protein